MNGTVPVGETRVEDLAHLDFDIRCEATGADAHDAQVFAVCRFCNRHTAMCELHLAMIRKEFAKFRARLTALGISPSSHIIKCTTCSGEASSFDDLFFTVPVKP